MPFEMPDHVEKNWRPVSAVDFPVSWLRGLGKIYAELAYRKMFPVDDLVFYDHGASVHGWNPVQIQLKGLSKGEPFAAEISIDHTGRAESKVTIYRKTSVAVWTEA